MRRRRSASGSRASIGAASLVEMALGVAIGAITFTGSVIAFAKLSGRMSGTPIILPLRHIVNLALFGGLVYLIYQFCISGGDPRLFWAITAIALAVRRAHHHPDRRRRHAGRRVDAELVLGLGGGRHRLHARQHRAHHHRRAGRLVGCDPVLHHVQGHEPQLHLGDRRRFRRRDGGTLAGRRRAEAGQARLGRGRGLHPEERLQGHHRAGLRHGRRPGPARAARNGATRSRRPASR